MVKEEIHEGISTFFCISGLILYISKWSWMYYVVWSVYFLFVISTILQVYYKMLNLQKSKISIEETSN